MSLHTYGFRHGHIFENPFRSNVYSIPDIEFQKKPLIYEFVAEVTEFTSQYGGEDCISYTAFNVTGKPSVYPLYGDFSESYFLRTYGTWWTDLPSAKMIHFPSSSNSKFKSREFFEVCFKEWVYPASITIYEIFNASAVVRILCYCFKEERWDVLWSGTPRVQPKLAHKFSPRMKIVNYMTNLFRIELHQDHLPYHYAVDAVLLVGSKRFIHDSAGIQYICSKDYSDMLTDCYGDPVCVSEDSSAENNVCYLEALPREVLLLILSYLDIESLCSTAKTSSFFKKLCYDNSLYRELDLQPNWAKVNDSTLELLKERCFKIRRLNLSWCGPGGSITTAAFLKFVKYDCAYLECLRLANCSFVNDDCVRGIADFCPFIQVLDLRNCRSRSLSGTGFLQISRMLKMKYLDLSRTLVDLTSIIAIINSCANLKHLFLGSCVGIDNYDEVCRRIAIKLPDIRTLDFWKATSLTGVGVNQLASRCPNLEELDLGWCREVSCSTNCIVNLATSCRNLKKLFLTGMRSVGYSEIMAISTHCKELEQLDILGTFGICGPHAIHLVERLLESCKRLRLLDVSFCESDIQAKDAYFRQNYPNVCIQFSCQSSEDF